MKLRHFFFYQRLEDLDAFLLIRIVGCEILQVPNCLVDALNRRTVRLEIGIVPREEIASLSGFRVNEPGHRLIKIPENLVGVLSPLGSFSESGRVPVGLPPNEYQNGRCNYESPKDQAISHFPFHLSTALPRSLGSRH